MRFSKKIIGELKDCYALTTMLYRNKLHLVAASETVNPCHLYDLEGNFVSKLWDSPGGVMTITSLPDGSGRLISSQIFYGTENSQQARLVLATPTESDVWKIDEILKLPFVHRFGFLYRNGIYYLLAATVKSDQSFVGDWSHPGMLLAAPLPKKFDPELSVLNLEIIQNGLSHNHGFSTHHEKNYDFALIGSDQGVHKIIPPSLPTESWIIEKLIDVPTSDMVLVDLDNDGIEELITFTPFHGDRLHIYKYINKKYTLIYEHKESMPFLHAIYGGTLGGQNCVIVGNRSNSRNLYLLTYDDQKLDKFIFEQIDSDIGSSNVTVFTFEEQEYILSANREINEVALYTVERS